MRIIIDAMGGDKAPEEIIRGAVEAAEEYDAEITLVGDEDIIKKLIVEYNGRIARFNIVHSDEVITMEDDPVSVVRAKKNSSMGIGLKLLRDGGDVFLSAGNTGALHAGSSLLIRTHKGIHRSAIGTILPFNRPILLLDSGANINITPEYMLQWAMLGSIYMKNIHGIENPAVGLINNGTEAHKGTQVYVDTYKLLSERNDINFAGNIESSQIPFGACDVLLADGFTGNIVLKYTEGMGKFMLSTLKGLFSANTKTKMAYLLMKNQVMDIKKVFDASEYGGAPFIGLSKPVIKAHGSSDHRAIKNAVKQAIAFVETGACDEFENVGKQFIGK